MLTDEQLEYISDALIPLFQYLESEVIADVTQRVKATMAYTRTAEQQAQALYQLGYSPARIRKEVMKKLKADAEFQKTVAQNTLEHKKTIKELLKKIRKEAGKAGKKLFADTGSLSFLDDLRVWELGHKPITDGSFLPKLVKAMEEQTKGELNNLTKTAGFKTVAGMEPLENVYRRELDKAMIKITTGTFSQEQVLYDVIHSLAHSGLRTIDYGSGRTRQLDTAVRVAIRTGTHQLMGKVAEQSIRETDTKMVYVSSHWGARNKGTGHANHAQWQGKVYTIGADMAAGAAEKEAERIGQAGIGDLWEATGYCMDGKHENDPLGLYGYNCRHRIYPWFEGISSLPDEDPEPKPVVIDGKEYDYYAMSQKQRAKERNIRALKREREAMQKLDMDTTQVQKKIKEKIREYEEWCKKYKMPEKYNRIRYDNGTGEYKKTKAWKEYETKHKADMESVAKEVKGDIMNIKGAADMSLEYQRYGRNKQTLINHTYIDSGEYRHKFDYITDNDDVNRVIYSKAKEMLKHRSGTEFEDMYWIDGTSGKIVAYAMDEKIEKTVKYTEKIKKAIEGRSNLITIHTHPGSMPPSIADFNSAFRHGYEISLVVCHDGKVFRYKSNEEINQIIYKMYIDAFKSQGYDEYKAQIKALEKIAENHDISFEEVLP